MVQLAVNELGPTLSRLSGRPSIELRDIFKTFGEVQAVNGISLDVRQGEFLTLLGPSGCGKTTTLRMIGGFELPSSGEIFIERELRTRNGGRGQGRAADARPRRADYGAATACRGTQAGGALRRTAAAGGAGACPGQSSGSSPPGRTARRA